MESISALRPPGACLRMWVIPLGNVLTEAILWIGISII